MEAVSWNQLGSVYGRANRLKEAEQAYGESARIREGHGDRVGAAQSWGNLANVMLLAERPKEAEAWYVKAVEAFKAGGDEAMGSLFLSNLASLLSERPGRVRDARAYAEQALAIKKTLDPAATQIWMTYDILAEIADKSGDADAARNYRRGMRASYAAAPICQETLRRHSDLIRAVVAAVADPSGHSALQEALSKRAGRGWTKLVEALRHVLHGERDEGALCNSLDFEDAAIVGAVLRGFADPAYLEQLGVAEPVADDAQTAELQERLKNIHR
jgi:hypothetical protein